MLRSTVAVPRPTGTPFVLMREVAYTENAYAAAWTMNAASMPTAPISAPAIDGPTMRMVFEPSELTATAFGRSSAPTTS